MHTKWRGEKNSHRFEKSLPNDEEKSVEIEVGFAVDLLAVVCPDDRYHAHTLKEGHRKNTLVTFLWLEPMFNSFRSEGIFKKANFYCHFQE